VDKAIPARRLLTNAAYTGIGRLQVALGRHADMVYAELETDADRGLAQRVFSGLVNPATFDRLTSARTPLRVGELAAQVSL
jgi:hypothetical protein